MRLIHKILIILISLAPALLASCGQQEAKSSDSEQTDLKTPVVGVVQPTSRDFSADVEIVGSAEADRKVTLHARESGYVTEMRVDIGDRVRKGEVIAVLENPELTRKAEKLRAQVASQKRVYTNLEELKKEAPSLTTIKEVEEARSHYESLKADLEAVEDQLAFLKVKAPFDGVITKRFIDEGALLQRGTDDPDATPIVNIYDLSTIRVNVPVPEANSALVQPGTPVDINFPEMPEGNYKGTVTRVAGALKQDSKKMQAEIDIPNPDGKIRPGMYARVNFNLESRKDILSLPNPALAILDDSYFIYTVEDDRVKRIPVKTGLTNNHFFEVLSAKVDSNDQVITQGKKLVENGMIVKTKKAK